MIGRLTELTLHAGMLGATWEQLAWPEDDDESYERLRTDAQELLTQIELDVKLPDTHAEYLDARPNITPLISQRLSADRGRILGDTTALTFYFLNAFALRATLHTALHMEGEPELELVEDCLEDLGLDRDLSRVLEREAGWIVLLEDEDDGEGPSVRKVDVIRAGGSFVVQMLEEFGRKEQGLEGLQTALVQLRDEVRDFREEYRETSARLAGLIEARDPEIVALLDEMKVALADAGIAGQEAEELTDGDPQTLWERVVRWIGGAQARDAAEAALWVALDFVPGGVGVKLGIRLAGAVRASLKASAK